MSFAKPDSRKLKILKVAPLILKNFFTEGEEFHYKIVYGLPQDARVINAAFDMDGNFHFLVQSETFEELKDGERIPEISVTMEDMRATVKI